jgi:DNA-binding IclR family transcriptional regulator
VLEAHRFVEHDPATARYRLGMGLVQLGQMRLEAIDLRPIAAPHMRALMERTRETVHLGVLEAGRMIYVDKVEGPRALRLTSQLGRATYAHCTALGKALLAEETADRVAALVRGHLPRLTRKTICSLPELTAHLARVRAQGYAVDDEEEDVGVRCVGSPIRGAGGAIAAISVSGPAVHMPMSRIRREIGPLVREAATRISATLGSPVAQTATRARAR